MEKKGAIYNCHFCGSMVKDTGYYCCDDKDLLIGKCNYCNIVQQIDFFHINLDYYKSSSYASQNIYQVRERERSWNNKRLKILMELIPDIRNRTILDFGCGPGGFLEVASPLFEKLYGFDLNSQYCKIHNQKGWKCYSSLELVPDNINTITMFHVLEHVKEPWLLLKELQSRFNECECFIIEVPNTDEALNSVFNCQAYRKNHYSSEHLYYFTYNTLQQIVEYAELKCVIQTGFQRYSLANNLGWLSKGKGGGQFEYPLFNDENLNDQYEKVLVENKFADSILIICQPQPKT